MKATLKNYRQSPRKVRLLADLIKGKKIDEAKTVLNFTRKRASKVLKKIVDSAAANARENSSLDPKDLYIKNVMVNEGYILKRIRPRAMGRAFRIRKRTSHIDVILGELHNDQRPNSPPASSPRQAGKTRTKKEKTPSTDSKGLPQASSGQAKTEKPKTEKKDTK